MKKFVHLFISFCLMLSFTLCTVSAAPYHGNDLDQSTEWVYFNDGSCLEIVTTVLYETRSSNKIVEKDFFYKVDGKNVTCYTLQGFFTYDGKTSFATDVSYSIDIYQSGWDVSDHEESYSGNTVRGTAVFSGPSGDKTIRGSITCDKNGNIS